MEKAGGNLDLGHEEEPDQSVYRALLAKAIGDGSGVLARVLLSDVVDELPQEQDMNSWQVGGILRTLDFEVRTAGGKRYAYTGGRERLIAIGRELGLDDEWFDEDGAGPHGE